MNEERRSGRKTLFFQFYSYKKSHLQLFFLFLFHYSLSPLLFIMLEPNSTEQPMNYQTEEQQNQQHTENQQEQSEETKELLFEVNEKVLCYHGPLIYEAKVKL